MPKNKVDLQNDKFEIFGNSDQGYTDFKTGSNDPNITGPQRLRILFDYNSRWQFIFFFNFFVLVVLILVLLVIGSFLGLVYRGPNGNLVVSRPNMTLNSYSKTLIPGENIQLLDEYQEITLSEIVFNSTDQNVNMTYYDECTTLSAIRIANRARDGYVNATEGHLSFWTSNTDGDLNKAMHIDEVQNVGIGTSYPVSRLTVNGTITTTNPIVVTCDKRVKFDIEEIPLEEAIQVVSKVKAKKYKRNNNPERVELGFIAQDFLELGNENVIVRLNIGKNKEEVLHLDQQAITAYMWTVLNHLINQEK